MSITVVGTVAVDTVETPFGKVTRALGGAATHFSAAASIYTKVNIIGIVGDDFPQEHIAFFKSRQINLEGLQIVPGKKTFHWEGKYDFDLNNAQTIATHLNVIGDWQPVVPESCKKPDILFLANIDPDQQRRVITQCGRPKFIALDTMNFWISCKKESLIETIKLVDLVTINETEARLITGKHSLVKAAKDIQALGPKIVVIKRGEYGALLFSEGNIFSAPALPLEDVFDPTGAGDSFAGGMIGYLDRCKSFEWQHLKTAVICGSVMASFNVEKFSCDRLKEINLNDTKARFAEFATLGKFEVMAVS